MTATLQWFGTATWRLEVDGYVAWLDAYLTRAPTAAPLPMIAAEVDRADVILIGHSHFDHIADAGAMANATGATVVGSRHSCDIVQSEGVADDRTAPCIGGESLRFGPLVVRTFRSLHGFNGLREWPDPLGRDRRGRVAAMRAESPDLAEAALAHLSGAPPAQLEDGGPLAYVIEWDGFRLFWHDTPGMVRESWEAAATLTPDLALFSAAAAFSTPNVDGEPLQEGQQALVALMTEIVRPKTVVLNHHDDWCPPITYHLDEEAFRDGVERAGAKLRVVGVGESVELSGSSP